MMRDPASGPLALTRREAVAAILFLAVAADGNINDAEEELVVAISNRMRLLRGQTPEEFNAMINDLRALLRTVSAQEVLEAAAKMIPAHLRDTMYSLAADLAFVDGRIADAERTTLSAMRHALDVPEALALKIEEVCLIKSRG